MATFPQNTHDLAKPGVRQVGKALSTVLGLGNTALFPLYLLNERTKIALEKNLESYRQKMQNTPEEEVCEVSPEIGVPIAEKLSYVSDEQLSEMYTQLLAKASKVHEADVAHPSFVTIIDNLSPDEAILLKQIQPSIGYPFVEVRFYSKDSNNYILHKQIEYTFPSIEDLRFRDNIEAYLSNLEGLGILNIMPDKSLSDNELYESIEENAKLLYLDLAKKQDREVTFGRGAFELTQFGQLFVRACTSPISSDLGE